MEFEVVNLAEITSQKELKNAMIIVSGGLAYVSHLPDFGKTELTVTSANGKVVYIDEKSEKKIKL